MSDTSEPVLDRYGLEVIPVDECWELVAATPIGRVAFVNQGEPVVLPVNFTVVNHQVAFRTARGTKFGVASMRRPVAFEVDGWDAETRSGWSVLIEGTADLVLDADEEAELDAMGLEPWAKEVVDTDWVRILPNDISGRRILPPEQG